MAAWLLLPGASWVVIGCSQEEGIRTYTVPRAPDPPVMSEFSEMLVADRAEPKWEAPEEWKRLDPGAMRKGSYQVEKGGAVLDISVTAFPGDVGGEEANVRRWASMIQMEPGRASEVIESAEPIEMRGAMGKLYRLETDREATFVLWVVHGDESWFFKMSGDRELALAERDRFFAFLGTIEFPS